MTIICIVFLIVGALNIHSLWKRYHRALPDPGAWIAVYIEELPRFNLYRPEEGPPAALSSRPTLIRGLPAPREDRK